MTLYEFCACYGVTVDQLMPMIGCTNPLELQNLYAQFPNMAATLVIGAAASHNHGAPYFLPTSLKPGDIAWPVDAQPGAQQSSPPPVNSSEKPPTLLQDVTELAQLIEGMGEQVQAINRLANSNALLAEAIMDQNEVDAEEEDSGTYLDGTAAPRKLRKPSPH